MIYNKNGAWEGMTASRLQFYVSKSNLEVAFEVAVLLGIRPTWSVGIWTFCLNVLAFETHCFHECTLLSLVIFA
jgi:hypothetical protein